MSFSSQNASSSTKTSSAATAPTPSTEKTTPNGPHGFCRTQANKPVLSPVDTPAVVSTAGNTEGTSVSNATSRTELSSSAPLIASQETPRPAVETSAVVACKPDVKTAEAKTTPSAPPSSKLFLQSAQKVRPASKKKKAKKSFRSLLKGMMKGSGKPRNLMEEKDALRQGLGGGAFVKVDKI